VNGMAKEYLKVKKKFDNLAEGLTVTDFESY
jgi:hypothetical protein